MASIISYLVTSALRLSRSLFDLERLWTIQSRILLFDFETWHCVLNRWYLALSERESGQWDRKVAGFDQNRKLLPPPLERQLRATP